MLISEFIEHYEINKVTNPEVEGLIEQCLTNLHPFYGYKGDVYSPDNWKLERLGSEELWTQQDPDELLQYVNAISLQMANEAEFNVSSGTQDRVYKYKDRTKTTKPNGETLTIDFIKIPLLMAMKDLLVIYQQEQPEVSNIIRATKLIACSEQLRLLIQLSHLWEDLSKRNYDQKQLDDKHVKFDKKPMNKLRKEIVFDLVKSQLQTNKAKTVDSMAKVIRKELNNKIDQLHQSKENVISISDEDELLNEVKPITLKRWITEAITECTSN